jgi:chloramphenicol 3-O phosphotransferase
MIGNIIFLNGTSGSGKSEIARSLQEHLDQPYLYFSIDLWLHMLPEKLMSRADEDLPYAHGQVLAEAFPRTMTAIHRSMATFMNSGVNLIVDHVLQCRDWLEECVTLLDGSRVLFVGVHCDPEEVRLKETQRKVPTGLGRRQMASVHSHRVYDLEVDTCVSEPGEIAQLIINAQSEPRLPTAFQQLREMFARGEIS